MDLSLYLAGIKFQKIKMKKKHFIFYYDVFIHFTTVGKFLRSERRRNKLVRMANQISKTTTQIGVNGKFSTCK